MQIMVSPRSIELGGVVLFVVSWFVSFSFEV